MMTKMRILCYDTSVDESICLHYAVIGYSLVSGLRVAVCQGQYTKPLASNR